MSSLTVLSFARSILVHVPWTHWVVMALVSLALTVILLIRKKCSVYGAIALGLTVFMGLFVLDSAVVIRYFGIMKHASGHNLTLDFSGMFQATGQRPTESISNIAVFIPFGFFLAEFLSELRSRSMSETKRLGPWHRIGWVALAAFIFSLCIESLQLILHVGFFELTDLVLNTVGGVVGASLAVVIRSVLGRTGREEVSQFKP